jgi:hypothetical protein
MKNIVDNPALGEVWLPLAKVLMALHQERLGDSVRIHIHSGRYVRNGDKKGPTISVHYLSNGEVIMEASANEALSRPLGIERYQSMEFIGFLVPKTDQGITTTDPEKMSELCNPKFVRIFENGASPEHLVELTCLLMKFIYEVGPYHSRFSFGASNGEHEFVHSLGLLERYAPSELNRPAAIFGTIGANPNRTLYKDPEPNDSVA